MLEIPIAALNHYAYCPHRCWRMFCAGEFVDNVYTVEGTTGHQRIHTVGEGFREEAWQVRGIWLSSQRYGLVGKADLVESEAGELYPVEYKRGKQNPWENDDLQVCAQGLCLEEMTGRWRGDMSIPCNPGGGGRWSCRRSYGRGRSPP